jgi:protein-disulfide isomerase
MRWVCVVSVIAASSCGKSPSKLDAPLARSAEPAREAPLDGDARVARLEHRLEKVAAALDQALGPADPDPALTYAVPVSEGDPVEGPRDAKITIVEGFDFLCPYCFLANPLVDQVRAKYPADVRVVSKYLVVHGPPAAAAGVYACAAARQGKYTEMKQALWSHLFSLEGGKPREHADEIDKLDELAASVGIDPARLASDKAGCQAWLSSGQQELAAVGVHATPAFFVNGRPLRERSLAGFDKLIAEELARADRSSVARADYYDKEIVGKGLRRAKGRFED